MGPVLWTALNPAAVLLQKDSMDIRVSQNNTFTQLMIGLGGVCECAALQGLKAQKLITINVGVHPETIKSIRKTNLFNEFFYF